MVERGPRFLAKAKRDIASEELRLGIFVVIARRILGGETIRHLGVAGRHQPAGDNEPLLPILGRMSRRADPEQKLGRGVVLVLFALLPRLREYQAWIPA